MSEDEKAFLVFRCLRCERHFGSLHSGSSHSCPGCGVKGKHKLVERAVDENDLLHKVSLLNVPQEFRATLEPSIKRQNSYEVEDDNVSPRRLFRLLASCSDENNHIEFQSVKGALLKAGIHTPDAEDLIQMAESEGVLMRHTSSQWIWLG